MNASEFAALKKQAFQNSNLTPPANLNNPAVSTDWQDVVFRTGQVHDYNIGTSGGSKTSNYFISGSYYKNKGVVTDFNFERSTLRVNTETRRGRFKFGENLLISQSQETRPEGINPFYDMPQFLPIIPVQSPAYITADNPAGYGRGTDDAVSYAFNPVAVNALRRRSNEYSKIIGNAYLDLKILNWLNYRFNAGLEASFDFLKEVRKPGAWQYRQERADNSYIDEFRRRFMNTLFEHTLNFNKSFGDHSLNGVVGFSQQEVRREGTGAIRLGLAQFEGTYLTSITSATGAQTNSGDVDTWYRTRGILGRLNYAYKDRYLLTFSDRYDQDSRFAKDFRSGNFPSLALAWRASKENFFKVNGINDLKLRASYGELGIITVGSFQYLSLLNPYQVAIFGPGQTVNPGASQARLSNPDLRWERRIVKNIGIDGSFLNNRVSVSLDAYNSLSKTALITVELPNYLGNLGGNPPVNAASIRNTGVEVAITYREVNRPFTWDVSANLTTIKNTVLSVGNQGIGKNYIQLGNTRTQIGRSIGEWFVLETNGLFQNQQQIDNYKDKNGKVIQPQAKPGDIIYIDRDGNGIINNDDRTFKGSPWPKFQSGAQFNGYYKGFNLNVQLIGIFGFSIYNDVRRVLDSYENTNFRKDISPWTPQNTSTSDPRIGISLSDAGLVENMRGNSERWLENGSYVRMRNIELGYNIPRNAFGKINVGNARVYISAQNLFTITKYTGLDPDVVGNGIQERGLDNGNWPASRVVSFGVQFDF
jgi:TonB-linked SusC/RagA family outer membrane protein